MNKNNKNHKKGSNSYGKKGNLINDKYLERSVIEEIAKEFLERDKNKK